MGILRRSATLATLNRTPFTCRACGSPQFFDREVKLNSSGAELFGVGWANRSATGLICATCGFVHEFVGDALELWKVEGGYPQHAPT